MEIKTGTSPELAIKIAYDFARSLRAKGATEEQFRDQLEIWVEKQHATSPIIRYIRAGFAAGYTWQQLPWKRQIDEAAEH